MIDIHCHILPGVDDGAVDLEEALEMARIAEKEGIKKIINTSHFHPEFKYIMGEELVDIVDRFNITLKANKINLEVLLGNEIYYTDEIIENLDTLSFYTLNKSKYVLIEFSPMNIPKNLADVVYEVKLKGYTPVLAHVERYNNIIENPNIIYDCIKEGAIIQVNASSILGKHGKEIKRTSDILLDNNMVHIIASDAHGSERRRPQLKEAYNFVENKYSKEVADNLFNNNQSLIIKNEDIIIPKAIRYEEKKGLFSKLFKR
ncbi:tyrosine-protein phosphatase [Romboutsia sp. 1001713B170207_170306_H8]|uniref:tyrosine-protein phosphatase n=1 Tax=Romboutsia sp. 1001713B170207_170306_H8 TaxID=2787112 RepID=UPI000822D58C|nr:CpsB/CapC family capsule biosynthesis tyrosine phosphatase [Romboutsia sp. 1001713B170207_170306_H8]SCH16013.1 Tyrosine-protein phosphatase YwqE [uncultured Clostridium sp.]